MAHDDSPFTAPSTPLGTTGDAEAGLAPLGLRFVGAAIDIVIAWSLFLLPAGALVLVLGGFEAVDQDEFSQQMVGLTSLVGLLGWRIVQWSLVHSRAQSVGKILVGTRIVDLEGEPVGFLRGVVLREWPINLVAGLANYCCLGWAIFVIDGLWIFAAGERRCLHDRIAGTRVVMAVDGDRG